MPRIASGRSAEASRSSARPTDSGETLLAYARRMLALNDEMLDALAGATVAMTVRLGVPEDFAAVIAKDSAKWKDVVERAGVKPD